MIPNDLTWYFNANGNKKHLLSLIGQQTLVKKKKIKTDEQWTIAQSCTPVHECK